MSPDLQAETRASLKRPHSQMPPRRGSPAQGPRGVPQGSGHTHYFGCQGCFEFPRLL